LPQAPPARVSESVDGTYVEARDVVVGDLAGRRHREVRDDDPLGAGEAAGAGRDSPQHAPDDAGPIRGRPDPAPADGLEDDRARRAIRDGPRLHEAAVVESLDA